MPARTRREAQPYARYIESYADVAIPKSIHDLGCAFGTFLGSLDASWSIFGSDVGAFAIEQPVRYHPHGTFRVGDASLEPVFAGPFGVVTAFDVIEHVPDLDRLAKAVNGQLANRGIFVFVVPAYDGLSGPIIHLLDHDPTHIHKWPRHRWLSWAKSHFELLDWTGIIRYLLPTRPLPSPYEPANAKSYARYHRCLSQASNPRSLKEPTNHPYEFASRSDQSEKETRRSEELTPLDEAAVLLTNPPDGNDEPVEWGGECGNCGSQARRRHANA